MPIVPMSDDLFASAVVNCLLSGIRPVDIIISTYIIIIPIKKEES